MIKLNKNLLLIAVFVMGGTLGFTGCTTAPTTSNGGTNNAVVTNTNTTKTTTTTETKTETASTGDKIGVPECDDFLAKYEACVTGKVPEAQRAAFKTSVDQWRKSWKDLAGNPQTKSSLVSACKQAQESAKQSMNAFSCAW